jgi:hypothetical protein
MKYLLNEEVKRMQHLAGIEPVEHRFELFLERKSHLTIKEIISQLNEDDSMDVKTAQEYFNTSLDPNQQKVAAKIVKKIADDDERNSDKYMSLTKDEFSDKAADIASDIFNKPSADIVKIPTWKRIVTGILAGIIMYSSGIAPLGISSKTQPDKNIETIKKAEKELNQKSTANFKDFANLNKAKNLNPSLDDPGAEEVGHIQYKTGEYKISDKQKAELDQYASDVLDVVDNYGVDVDVDEISTFSNQAKSKYSNTANTGEKGLDKLRAKEIQNQTKASLKKVAAEKGYEISEEGDNIKVKTSKGTNTIKVTSKIAPEKGKPNKTGDVDQGTTIANKFKKPIASKIAPIWRGYISDLGGPRFAKGEPTDKGPGEETGKGREDRGKEEIPGGGRKLTPTDKDETPGEETGIVKPIPTGDADPDEAKKIFKDKSLYRNQEIFGVLKMANPNIKGDINDKSYKSWDPSTFKTIELLRKSPDVLLKKFQSVTGINVSPRQKTRPKSFQRSGMAEQLMLETLMLLEAAIDKKLEMLGITDDAIRKNKVEIMAMLMKMYNLKPSDIPDEVKKLAPDEQKQLKAITVSEELDTMFKKFSDVERVKNDLNLSTQLKTALGRINTYDEFEALILGMAALVNPNFAKQKIQIKAALSRLADKVKKLKEESETPTDTQGVYKIIETLKLLKNHLQAINTQDEFEALVFALLGFIDSKGTITSDKNRLANAIIAASNRSSLKDPKPIDLDKLGR